MEQALREAQLGRGVEFIVALGLRRRGRRGDRLGNLRDGFRRGCDGGGSLGGGLLGARGWRLLGGGRGGLLRLGLGGHELVVAEVLVVVVFLVGIHHPRRLLLLGECLFATLGLVPHGGALLLGELFDRLGVLGVEDVHRGVERVEIADPELLIGGHVELLNLLLGHALLLQELVNLLLGEVPQGHGEEVVVGRAVGGDWGALLGDVGEAGLGGFSLGGGLGRLGHPVVAGGLELSDQHALLLAADGDLTVDDGEDEARLVGHALELKLRLADEHGAPAGVGVEAEGHECFHDSLGGGVLGDGTLRVERVHVRGGHLGAELELLLDAVLLGLGHVLRGHGDDEVDGGVGVMLPERGDKRSSVLLLGAQHVLQEVLVVGGPGPQGKLGDHQRALVLDLVLAGDVVPNLTLDDFLVDGPVKVAVPRVHSLGALVVEDAADVGDDIARVKVGDGRGPTRADTVGAVDQQQGHDRKVVLGLDHLPVLVEVIEEGVVALGEDDAADGREPGEDVTRGRVVLAALEAGTELAGGDQQVDVVAPDEILREAHDCGR